MRPKSARRCKGAERFPTVAATVTAIDELRDLAYQNGYDAALDDMADFIRNATPRKDHPRRSKKSKRKP